MIEKMTPPGWIAPSSLSQPNSAHPETAKDPTIPISIVHQKPIASRPGTEVGAAKPATIPTKIKYVTAQKLNTRHLSSSWVWTTTLLQAAIAPRAGSTAVRRRRRPGQRGGRAGPFRLVRHRGCGRRAVLRPRESGRRRRLRGRRRDGTGQG